LRPEFKTDETTFWAITGLGWGSGSTLVEARENYLAAQHRNFPKLTDEELDECWGFYWQPPEGTTGFGHEVKGLYWYFDDKDGELADPSQRVAYLGNVPESVQTIHETRKV